MRKTPGLKQGNLSKVKYFLPHHRQPLPEPPAHQPTRKLTAQSNHKYNSNKHTRSMQEPTDISFEIVGLTETQPQLPLPLQNHQNNVPKGSRQGKRDSLGKHGTTGKGVQGQQQSVEAGLSSIRALTRSREWKLPEGAERDEFMRFIETLKKDETYQETITMFTIMYFYEGRGGKE